jgi:hypothetical protein
MADEARKGGNVPVEFVRFGRGEAGRVMGVDCDRPGPSFSLSLESRLAYAGAAEDCVANILGGADGDSGLIEGVSVFTGTSSPGDPECGSAATTAVAILPSVSYFSSQKRPQVRRSRIRPAIDVLENRLKYRRFRYLRCPEIK